MKDAIIALVWILMAIWYAGVLHCVPEAPNPPPRSSRFWLSHKLLWGRRLAWTLAGLIGIGLGARFIIAALPQELAQ